MLEAIVWAVTIQGKLSRGGRQLSGDSYPEGNYPGGNSPGVVIREAIVLEPLEKGIIIVLYSKRAKKEMLKVK